MIRRHFLLVLACLFTLPILRGQHSNPNPNLDFSSGDFTGWKCYIASSFKTTISCYDSLSWTPLAQASEGRHTIMTDIYGTDKNTISTPSGKTLALIPDGYSFSARIGNSGTGSQAEAIRYTLTVDSQNCYITVHYAAVLCFGYHVAEKESRFGIRIQDTTGKPLPVGNMELSIGDWAQLIERDAYIRWKDWDAWGADLSPWIGQKVELVIYAADCGSGGHFGYGYAVCECGPGKSYLTYCQHNKTSILEAPFGYASYLWTDGSGRVVDTLRRVKLPMPVPDASYRCILKNKQDVTDTQTVTVRQTLIQPSMQSRQDSQTRFVRLANTSRITGDKTKKQVWQIGKLGQETEFTCGDSVFEYLFKDTGRYEVFMTVYAQNGCSDTCSRRFWASQAKVDVEVVAFNINYLVGDTVQSSSLFHPEVSFANHGNTNVYGADIRVELYDSARNLLNALTKRTHLFMGDTLRYRHDSSWRWPSYNGTAYVKAYMIHSYETDTFPANDTLWARVFLKQPRTDVGGIAFDKPSGDTIRGGSLFSPEVRFVNYGKNAVTGAILYIRMYDSAMILLKEYTKTINLSVGDTLSSQTFSSWQWPNYTGKSYLKAFMALANETDSFPANDTLWKDVFLYHADTVRLEVTSVLANDGNRFLSRDMDTCRIFYVTGFIVKTSNYIIDSVRLTAQVCDSAWKVLESQEKWIPSSVTSSFPSFFKFPKRMRVPNYDGSFYIRVFFDSHPHDYSRQNDTCFVSYKCHRALSYDMEMLSVTTPTDTSEGRSLQQAEVALCYGPRKDLDLTDIPLFVDVLDENHSLIQSLYYNLPVFRYPDTMKLVFATPYRVPNYTGVYYLRAYFSLAGDYDHTNDTVTKMLHCFKHPDTVDLQKVTFVYPAAGDTLLAGKSFVPEIIVSARGASTANSLRFKEELYDEHWRMVDSAVWVDTTLFSIGMRGKLCLPSMKTPSHSGKYHLRVFAWPYPEDMYLHNDTAEAEVYCRNMVDLQLLAISLSDTGVLKGGSWIHPSVKVANPLRNAEVSDVEVYVEVSDSIRNLALLRQRITHIGLMDTVEQVFADTFQVPDYTGRFWVKAYLQSDRWESDCSNDTLLRSYHCQRTDALPEAGRENWSLGQNIPNPTDGKTLIPVTLPEDGRLQVSLFSEVGRLLWREETEARQGQTLIPIDASGFASGIYFYSVECKGERRIGKMQVAK